MGGWKKKQKVSKQKVSNHLTSGMAVKLRLATDNTFLRGFVSSWLGEQ